MQSEYDAAKRTALEKALAAAKEKLEFEQMMVATYNEDKVAGAQAAVDAIETLLAATVPCDDCGAPIPYYDGKTLCKDCYTVRVKALEAK